MNDNLLHSLPARRAGLLLVFLLVLGLSGCQRGRADEAPAPASDGTPPTPVIEEATVPTVPSQEEEGGIFDGITLPAINGNDVEEPPAAELGAGKFEALRFATDGQGEPQSVFPPGTEEIYAIWDYSGLSATDQFTRKWFHNDGLVVEHPDKLWDYLLYGPQGTVRDIFYYDRIDGVDPGRWRVELYLNGTLQQTAEFDVQ